MRNENPIFRSLAMIEERIQEKMTIENLAEGLYLSKYHYQRLFRETVGDSVMRYVARRRLTLAAHELAQHKEITVLEIALKYGYDTHEGFTRSFRAYMGITPAEYRKYHCAVSSPIVPKERCVMMYSKITDEMLRELNALIVQAKEAADYTRKNRAAVSQDCTGYAGYWEHIADKADAMAQALGEVLRRITGIVQQPDAISARFVLIKAIEEAAFWADILAFETGLTAARAMPQHRVIFEPFCEKYDRLSQSAQMKAEKIALFFSELSTMIFEDLRKNAQEHLKRIVKKGKAVYGGNSSGYIVDEIRSIISELAETPLEELTVRSLEDALFRVNVALFAADVDLLRMPSDKALFDSISELKEQLIAGTQYFKSLSADFIQEITAPQKAADIAGSHQKEFCVQGKVLLFYLRGELQKLGNTCLSRNQQEELNALCAALEECLGWAQEDTAQTGERIQAVYDALLAESAALGEYGGPVQYIANQLRRLGRLNSSLVS
ncbi:MAG: helix-turn-helix transcriptional regulator [Lachnospiraceae bacterium]|nr:helix-turn-helix transcriptional regulator [Lachnospiraceae bacterium]